MSLLSIREIELTLEQARTQETLNDIGSIKNSFARASIVEEEPAPAPAPAADGLPDDVAQAARNGQVEAAARNQPEAPDVPAR